MRKNSTLLTREKLKKQQEKIIIKNQLKSGPSLQSVSFIIAYAKSTKNIKTNSGNDFLISLN